MVFAAEVSSTLVSGVVSAVVLGLILGIFKGIEWLRSKWSAENAIRNRQNQTMHWTEITGEIRPVTASECKDKHNKLSEDLTRGSNRFNSQAETITNVEKAILRMEGDIKAGFASIPSKVHKTVESALTKHETGPLHGYRKKQG